MTHEGDAEVSSSQQTLTQQERVGESADHSVKQTDNGWKQLDVTFCADGDAMLVGLVAIHPGRIH